jgi:ribosomal protein L40E
MAEPARVDQEPPASEADLDRATVDRIGRALWWALPLLSIASAAIVGLWFGFGTSLLVLAGGVLLGVIAILWASVRTLAGDAPLTLEEALALGAPSAAEEQKRAVLQALKDLEYERSVGKVADADYEELLQRYRTEAKRLLRAVDEDLAPLRAKASAYVAAQLGRREVAAPPVTKSKHGCPSCQADNDVDAVFCKKCGGKLETSKERRDATA